MRRLAAIACTMLVFGLIGAATLAKPKKIDSYDPYAPAQRPGHVYLVEKNPDDWTIVEGGAWGVLNYKASGKFVFNGKGLEPNTDYTLIEYPKPQDTWPWPVNEMASGTSNGKGNINLEGNFDIEPGDYIWLVLTDDIVGGSLSGWNPTEYLFEYDVIV